MQIKSINLKLNNIEINNITQRTIAIVGGKGSGKTQTLKMLAYKAGEQIPVYIFDPMDNIKIDGFQRVVITRTLAKKADVNKKDMDIGDDLGKKYGTLFNRIGNKKIIFAFRDMLQEEIVYFCNAFFKNWRPEHSLILFDEMHELTPERGMGMEYSEEIERAVRHWRNKDDGFIFVTQRPAFTSTKVKGLIDFLILYRTTYTNDVIAIKDLVKNMLSEKETDILMSKLQTKPFLEGYTVNFMPTQQKDKIEETKDEYLKRIGAISNPDKDKEKELWMNEERFIRADKGKG